jgi:malonate transporter MadL subunit
MIIYGTALLAACHLLGIFLGELLGHALGVKTNVGGVGIAMLLLIVARLYMAKKDILPKLTELGVEYWGAMYIPVVVAMAAQQDVVAALRGGPVALISALGAAALCACVIALINRTEKQHDTIEPVPVLHDNPLLLDTE